MRDTSTTACKQPPGVIVPAVDLRRCEGKGDPRQASVFGACCPILEQ